jgi:hypothetical protein
VVIRGWDGDRVRKGIERGWYKIRQEDQVLGSSSRTVG